METIPIYIFLIIGISGIVLLFIVIQFLNELQNIILEKRFLPFSMKANNEQDRAFFDSFFLLFYKWIHKTAQILKKSHVLQNYAKRYEKYIEFSEEQKEGMDYIAFKFFIGILFCFFNMLSVFLKIHFSHFVSYIFTFFLGFFLPDIVLSIQFKKKRKEVEEGLLRAIIIMNNSFKSGKNIMQAISSVKNELDGPIADEFKKIYLDITYGLSLEVVFERFYERVKLEDAKYIASSLTLLNKTGGNIVRVFASIEKSFFNKKKMHDELSSLTASSVFMFRVLVALPILFSIVISLLNPTYFKPLLESLLGFLLLSLILILYVFYILIIKKVLKVKM